MTPAIYFTDLHLHKYTAFSKNHDRLEDGLMVLDDVFKAANKRGAKIILMSGDLFDTVMYLMTEVLTRTIKRFSTLTKTYPDIVMYGVTGNHDFAKKNLIHAPTLSALEHLAVAFPDNFKLIDNDVVYLNQEKVLICGIPCYEYAEHFTEALKQMHDRVIGMKAKGYTIILMIHQKPSGNPNPNVKIETDVDDPLYAPFDMVLCGDIHTSKRITDKFLLGGNPLHRDLNDAGKEKGIWYLDLNDPQSTLKFISRKGRYPEFVIAAPGDEVPANAFVVPAVSRQRNAAIEGFADADKFAPSVSHTDLLTNYWALAGKGDKELLAVGLQFLQK